MSLQNNLIKSGLKLYFVLSGGGSELLPLMLTQGGSSAYLVGEEIPYSTKALAKFLNVVPESYCSEATARQLAVVASEKARELADWPSVPNYPDVPYANDEACWGVSCTASLAKKDERSSRVNKAFIAAHGYKGTFSDSIIFDHSWVVEGNNWEKVRAMQERDLAYFIYNTFLSKILEL